jgi:dolichol-phosphate mannosyltransferase/undecaprenyl-phosphate 4-deoxy-4-formamido-L-arabinose transferase
MLIQYSIVIPVYNSTNSLQELADRLDIVFKKLNVSYEIIFVDDASPNAATWPLLEKLAQTHKNIRCFQLMRNFGKPGAMICGLEQSIGEYIITMDDDLQHFPEDIPKLISLNKHDVVVGAFSNKEHSLFKKFGSNVHGWFENKIIGKPKHIKNSPFKLIKGQVVRAALEIKTPYPHIGALLFYVTKDIAMIEVGHGKRMYNKTGFTLKKMIQTFSHLLINNSSFLLQKMAFLGISISILSFILGLYFLVKKITVGTPVQGWTSLAIINLFLGGLILFSIGVVGEYLIRIINGIERRPSFIVRRSIDDKP